MTGHIDRLLLALFVGICLLMGLSNCADLKLREACIADGGHWLDHDRLCVDIHTVPNRTPQ